LRESGREKNRRGGGWGRKCWVDREWEIAVQDCEGGGGGAVWGRSGKTGERRVWVSCWGGGGRKRNTRYAQATES